MSGLLKKIDIFLDILRKNYKFLLISVLALTGTNVGQYFYMNQPHEVIKIEKPIITNTTVTKTVIQKLDYSKVKALIKQHEKELH